MSQNQNSVNVPVDGANILEFLSKNKEIIATCSFFIGGAVWIFGYFATKEQLSETQSAMKNRLRRYNA